MTGGQVSSREQSKHTKDKDKTITASLTTKRRPMTTVLMMTKIKTSEKKQHTFPGYCLADLHDCFRDATLNFCVRCDALQVKEILYFITVKQSKNDKVKLTNVTAALITAASGDAELAQILACHYSRCPGLD